MAFRASKSARKHENKKARRMSKAAALTSGLVAFKGQGASVNEMPTRQPEPAPVKIKEAACLQPLNFRVSNDFRREFKTYAASHDLKLNELLKRSFAAYRKQNGD